VNDYRSIGQIARERIKEIQLKVNDEELGRRLFYTFRTWQDHDERERAPFLAERIHAGECAIQGDWCLTHNEEENVGHANTYRGTTLD
jgi:hypothetical protein